MNPPADSVPIQCRASTPLNTLRDGVLMYMPAGVHLICAGLGGQSDTKGTCSFYVEVGADDAAAVQASFAENSQRHPRLKAFFDKEHEGKEATAWPQQFFWSDTPEPGIYARSESSSLGRQLIEGKVFRGFSGQFFTDADLPRRGAVKAGQAYAVAEGKRGSRTNPARITSIDFPIAGGFTNFPAFRTNLPLAAKHAGSSSTNQQPHIDRTMKKTKAELEAEIQQLENDLAQITARDQSLPETTEALAEVNQKRELAQARLDAASAEERASIAEAEQVAVRARDAAATLGTAVARGIIKPKDEAMKSHWLKRLTDDPNEAKILLAMNGTVALDRPAAVRAHGEAIVPRSVITRASNENVFNELSVICANSHGLVRKDSYKDQIELGKKFGQLYTREIKPRLKEGDDLQLPVLAANALGTLAESLVATRTLENLMLSMPLLSRISQSFSDQIVSYGDTLTTHFISDPSVVSYNTTTGWADSDMTATAVAMTYDKHKGVQIMLHQQDIAGTTRRLFDEIAPKQSYVLGKAIVDDLYAIIIYAAFTGETNKVGGTAAERSVGLGSFGRSTVVDLSGDLDDNGNPDMGRFLVLARPYWSALKKDQTIISLATQTAGQNRIIEKGVLPDIEDFDIIKGTNLPATAINGKTLKGFAGTKSSLLLATRLSADYFNVIPGAGNGILQVISLGDTGISANLVLFVDNKLGRAYRRLELIYSVKAGQELAGQLLTDV